MKKGFNWLTVLMMFVAGVLLIIWHGRLDVLSWVVMAVGVMLIVPGVYDFVKGLRRGASQGDSQAVVKSSAVGNAPTIVVSVAAVALGLWMLINPSFFVGVLAYAFGALLIFIGIYHVVNIAYWTRDLRLPGFLYVVPALLIVTGLVILFSSIRTLQSVVVLIMGISLVASAVNSLLEYTTATVPVRRQE